MSRLKDVYIKNPSSKDAFHLIDIVSIQQVGNNVIVIRKNGVALSMTDQTIFNLFDKLFDVVESNKL